MESMYPRVRNRLPSVSFPPNISTSSESADVATGQHKVAHSQTLAKSDWPMVSWLRSNQARIEG